MIVRRWTGLLLFSGLLALPGTGEAQRQDTAGSADEAPPEHAVAVLSPSDGPLREVGTLHDESVKRVFRLGTGNFTTIRGHEVRFLFRGTGNPVADTLTCVEEARRVVEEEGAVAILGPVSSGCTGRVLAQDLRVPVVSSLSTARSLGRDDDWFFRTIAHDRRRLETFVDTARGRDLPIESAVAIYESSSYGEGLLEHLSALVPSVDSVHSFRWDEVFDAPDHEVGVTDGFRHEMDTHHAIGAVFVLGSSETMVEHVRALDGMFASFGEEENDPLFVLFGATEPAGDLPDGTWIIAEAQVATSRNLVTALREQEPSEDLYLSSLDAALALRESLRAVFRDHDDADAPEVVREEVRARLEQNTFASAERYRSFDFVDGEITPTPPVPIYRVSVVEERRVESVNPDVERSWVEIRLRDRPSGHLEGPVVVDLVPHGEELVNETVTLRVGGLGGRPVDIEDVELLRGGTTVSFTPSFFSGGWFPTSLWVGTDRTPPQERLPIEGLGWPASYAIALLSALVGALLYARYRTRDDEEAEEGAKGRRTRLSWTFAERCVAGLVIAFLIIHIAPLLEGEPMLSSIPIPQFGSSRWFNAFASGLLGGWLGLNPIVGLASSVIGALTPIFHSEG